MTYDNPDNDSLNEMKENTSGNGYEKLKKRRFIWRSMRFSETAYICIGTASILASFWFPMATYSVWSNAVYKIKESIIRGDSGHLILSAALFCLLCAVQGNLQFLGTILLVDNVGIARGMGKIKSGALALCMIVLFHAAGNLIFDIPYELVIVLLASVISLLVYDRLLRHTGYLQIAIVSTQLYFAMQWLNIMPMFTVYRIGLSDIPVSIKLTGQYLDATAVLNFTGFAFFLPFLFSAFVTTILFISYAQNMRMMRENYEKESQIKNMKAKILENRIYKEVKSLIHDLKTPLVTIRGLNSLLVITKDEGKILEYTDRIENSVIRMNDMISGFLYDSMQQRLKSAELISFVRAQLPLDNDTIRTEFVSDERLPDIHVNKIRVARAVINILENAIIVPCTEPYKHIVFESRAAENGLIIRVHDNGMGIRPEDMEKIWEVGYSSNNTSGLGLPFARQIIEDNGGTIEIESSHGKGTVVTIFLPSEAGVAGDSCKISDLE